MNNLDFKYKIYGRIKGRKKNSLNLDKNNIDRIFSKSIKFKKESHNILDIGSGNGENSIHLANLYPNANIIACEIFNDGNVNLFKNINLNKLKNITIYNNNVLKLIDEIKDKKILDSVWILFPDPWPKKRHHKRRLINTSFIENLCGLIKSGGYIHICTDSNSYCRQILQIIYQYKEIFLWQNQSKNLWEFDSNILPKTKYYKKAIKYDRKPIYIQLKKL